MLWRIFVLDECTLSCYNMSNIKGCEGKSKLAAFVQRVPVGVMGYDRSRPNMVPELCRR